MSRSFIEVAAKWLSDPFGREEISKHDEITEVMRETKERSSLLLDLNSRRNFPIASTVGNQKLRGRSQYVQ
jgi:hypothetical protein